MKIFLPVTRCFMMRLLLGLAVCPAHVSVAQILMSGGTNYAQSFDTLAVARTGNAWADNVTLPGWYAATNLVNWTSVATNRLTANYLSTFSTNVVEAMKFFCVRTD